MYFINNYYYRIRFHLLKIFLNTLQAIKYLFIQCIRQLYLYIYRLNMSILFWCLYNPQNEMLPFHKTKCSETQNEASSL